MRNITRLPMSFRWMKIGFWFLCWNIVSSRLSVDDTRRNHAILFCLGLDGCHTHDTHRNAPAHFENSQSSNGKFLHIHGGRDLSLYDESSFIRIHNSNYVPDDRFQNKMRVWVLVRKYNIEKIEENARKFGFFFSEISFLFTRPRSHTDQSIELV